MIQQHLEEIKTNKVKNKKENFQKKINREKIIQKHTEEEKYQKFLRWQEWKK